jgi:hypothetical protein
MDHFLEGLQRQLLLKSSRLATWDLTNTDTFYGLLFVHSICKRVMFLPFLHLALFFGPQIFWVSKGFKLGCMFKRVRFLPFLHLALFFGPQIFWVSKGCKVGYSMCKRVRFLPYVHLAVCWV